MFPVGRLALHRSGGNEAAQRLRELLEAVMGALRPRSVLEVKEEGIRKKIILQIFMNALMSENS